MKHPVLTITLVAIVIVYYAVGLFTTPSPMNELQRQMKSGMYGVPESEVAAVDAQLEALKKDQAARGVSKEAAVRERIALLMETRAKFSPRGKVELTLFQRNEQLGHAALMPEEKEYVATMMLDAEVKNGGFDQYFLNPSGDSAPDALRALIRNKLEKSRALLEQAMELVGTPFPTDQDQRNKTMEGKSKGARFAPFDPLDDAYYATGENVVEPAFLAMVAAYRAAGIAVPEIPAKAE